MRVKPLTIYEKCKKICIFILLINVLSLNKHYFVLIVDRSLIQIMPISQDIKDTLACLMLVNPAMKITLSSAQDWC